jgi:hypothetical protein
MPVDSACVWCAAGNLSLLATSYTVVCIQHVDAVGWVGFLGVNISMFGQDVDFDNDLADSKLMLLTHVLLHRLRTLLPAWCGSRLL